MTPGTAGQSVACSMAMITHNDFDCLLEIASKNFAIVSKKEWTLYLFQGLGMTTFRSEELDLDAPARTQP